MPLNNLAAQIKKMKGESEEAKKNHETKNKHQKKEIKQSTHPSQKMNEEEIFKRLYNNVNQFKKNPDKLTDADVEKIREINANIGKFPTALTTRIEHSVNNDPNISDLTQQIDELKDKQVLFKKNKPKKSSRCCWPFSMWCSGERNDIPSCAEERKPLLKR